MREYFLEELATYGFCPMKWRYRYEWKLPYYEADSQQAYYFSVRKGIARYVNALATGSSPRYAASAATNTYMQFMVQFDQEGAFTFGQATRLVTDGKMALQDFHRRVICDKHGAGFAAVRGADAYAYCYVEEAKIAGHLDIVLKPPTEDKSGRTIAVCHITNEKSSMYSARFMPVQYGWTVAALRQHVDEKASIHHTTFSPWTPQEISLTKNLYSRSVFTGTVRGLLKGVEARAVWQTPDRNRCKVCCYNIVCEARHSRDLKSSEIRDVGARVKKWPSRRANALSVESKEQSRTQSTD